MEDNKPEFQKDNTDNTIFDTPENVGQSDFPRVRWVLITLMVATLGGSALGLMLFQVIASLAGWGTSFLSGVLPEATDAAGRGQLRLLLGLNHFCTFVVPGVFTLWVFYQRYSTHWIDYIRARKMPDINLVGWSILALLTALPLVLFSYQINKLIPLPEVLRTLENDQTETLKNLLVMDTPFELLANLIIIALLPGIGEEFLFRGIIQQQLQRRVSSPWIAILATALIFSAIHLQFEGFLPRALLGLLLGWLYWRTNNFWVPAIAHFFNNGIQVVAQYLYGHEMSSLDLEKNVEIPWVAAACSAFLLWMIVRQIDRYRSVA